SIAIVAAALMAGCSSDYNSTQPSPTATNLTGTWKGTVSNSAGSLDFTTTLTQNGNMASGGATFAGGAVGNGTFTGTTSSTYMSQTFTFTISGTGTVNNVSCTLNLSGSGEATSTTITGTFTGTNSCLGGPTTGTITLTKQ